MSTTATELRQAYALDGPALGLGAVVVAGAAAPDARVRLPLSMLDRHGRVAGATGTGRTTTLQLARVVQASPLRAEYGTPVDRNSTEEGLLAEGMPPEPRRSGSS